MKNTIIILSCFCCLFAKSQIENQAGFYHRSSVGVVAGSSSNLTFNTANGIRFKNGWENGFGFGVERYYGMFTSPLYVESRMNFLGNKFENTEFFAGMMGGYQSVLGNNRKGEGYTAGLNIGMTHYLNKHAAIYTSLGYRFVWLKEDPNNYYYPYYTLNYVYNPYYFETSEIHRIELRVGLRFH